MDLLIPSCGELAGWAGVLVTTFLFIGGGRLLAAGRAAPEAALVIGWGAACLILTLWGVVTRVSLVFPAVPVMMLGAAGLLLPRTALGRGDWQAMGRMLAVGLPLLAVMASARPSLPDTFLNLLPNAAYLWDHGGFPADSRFPSYSFLPGAPYNMQLAGYVASLLAHRLALNAMIGFNIVLQLALALLLARFVTRSEDRPAAAVPPWGAAALGLLLATLINPGFVPRYHFSAYSEASVAVTTAFAGWFATLALERLAGGRMAREALVLLALALAALVNIKQDSVALAVGIVVSSIGVTLLERRAARGRSLILLVMAAAPAALLYGAWRWYVLDHFAVGELKLLPFRQWQFALIPTILRSMAADMVEKAYFFLAVLVALAGLARHWRRHGLDRTGRLGAIFAGVTLVYNAAVFFTYIAHFGPQGGAAAHSYFRYNTHLAPLLMLTLVLLARDLALERGWQPGRWRRPAAIVLVAVAALSPVAFFGYLRFDLEPSQQRTWLLAAAADRALDRDRRLALLLPGDNDSVATMLDGLIRFARPRHLDADLRVVETPTAQSLGALAAAGYRFALLSCASGGIAGVPPSHAALLEYAHESWRPVSVWSYPPGHLWVRTSHVLADATLCLPPG